MSSTLHKGTPAAEAGGRRAIFMKARWCRYSCLKNTCTFKNARDLVENIIFRTQFNILNHQFGLKAYSIFVWRKGRRIVSEADLAHVCRVSGNYSCLVAEFHMKRSISFHLIQGQLLLNCRTDNGHTMRSWCRLQYVSIIRSTLWGIQSGVIFCRSLLTCYTRQALVQILCSPSGNLEKKRKQNKTSRLSGRPTMNITYIQSGAAGCVKGFLTCYLKVPLACLGSMAAAFQPNLPVELSENMLQNLFLNLPPKTVLRSAYLKGQIQPFMLDTL